MHRRNCATFCRHMLSLYQLIKFDVPEIFTGDNHHEWAFVRCPITNSPNKSNMADGGHLEFRNVLITTG